MKHGTHNEIFHAQGRDVGQAALRWLIAVQQYVELTGETFLGLDLDAQ